MHDLRLIHTDLKPEIILLVSPECVKILDCKGSSMSPKEVLTPKEFQNLVLSCPRSYVRTWMELPMRYMECRLHPGGTLFGRGYVPTHEDLEHLAMMERVFGALPHHMFKNADLKEG